MKNTRTFSRFVVAAALDGAMPAPDLAQVHTEAHAPIWYGYPTQAAAWSRRPGASDTRFRAPEWIGKARNFE